MSVGTLRFRSHFSNDHTVACPTGVTPRIGRVRILIQCTAKYGMAKGLSILLVIGLKSGFFGLLSRLST